LTIYFIKKNCCRQKSSSLTKKEKQEINARRKVATASAAAATAPSATAKQLKTMENRRRIKRRHTVGGTKDIPSLGKENFVGQVSTSGIYFLTTKFSYIHMDKM
jgi:hypothetical protein